MCVCVCMYLCVCNVYIYIYICVCVCVCVCEASQHVLQFPSQIEQRAPTFPPKTNNLLQAILATEVSSQSSTFQF